MVDENGGRPEREACDHDWWHVRESEAACAEQDGTPHKYVHACISFSLPLQLAVFAVSNMDDSHHSFPVLIVQP